jgi:hypothetical protein
VVQPFTTPGNLVRYLLPDLAGDAHVTPGRGARLSLWLNSPAPLAPARGQEVEVVISDIAAEPYLCPWYAPEANGHERRRAR